MTVAPTTTDQRIRLAIVGCGTAAQRLHLPVLVGRDDCQVTTLVDPALDRAAAVARRFGVEHVIADHGMLADVDVDAAIVAAPNHLHASVALDLMRQGIDVLVEKPLARTVAEVDDMLTVESETGAVVGVGMELRFTAVNRNAKALLDNGAIGRVTSFSAHAGVEFGWPVATPFILRKGAAGGGVLIDAGVHVLDLLLWWLGDAERVDYRDDSYGGVEADCLMHLTLESGAEGTVELSRTRDLGHSIRIHGDEGDLEVRFMEDELTLSVGGAAVMGGPPPDAPGARGDILWSMAAEHDDFLSCVRTRRTPLVSLGEARRSLAVVEDCYGNRAEWELPWMRTEQVGRAVGGDETGGTR